MIATRSSAQDPGLPAMNLGLTTMGDAVVPPPGLFYNNYTQVYQMDSFRDANGGRVAGDLKVNSLLSLHQLVYISRLQLLQGNVHFTAMLPVVKITASGSAPLPIVNQGVLSDVTVGAGIQWYNKKLFNQSFWHRVELDLTVPSGTYHAADQINASGHLYTAGIYYSFSYFFSDRLSLGSRNQINYNFKQIGAAVKPGAFYNINYALNYKIVNTLHIAAVGYYLGQFNQDSFQGDGHYFQDKFGISDTRERVLGIGPGVSYTTTGGVFLEGKVFFETAVQNRSQGLRPTLRMAIPLFIHEKK